MDEVLDASFEVLRRDRRIGEFPVGDSSQLEWRVHVEKMRLKKRKSVAKVTLWLRDERPTNLLNDVVKQYSQTFEGN